MNKLYALGHLGTDRLWLEGVLASEFFGGSLMHFVNGLSFTGCRSSLLSSCNRPVWAPVLDVWSTMGHNADQVYHADFDAAFDCHYDANLNFVSSSFRATNLPDILSLFSQFKIESQSHLHFGTLPVKQLASLLAKLSHIDGLTFSAQTHISLLEGSDDVEIFSGIASQLRMLFLNLDEASLLSRIAKHKELEIANYYGKLGPIVFITDSDRASVVSDQYSSGWVAAPKVKVVDPTGAGDTFAGAALGTLLGGSHEAAALSLAIAIASLSTTSFLASPLFSIHREVHRQRRSP